LHYLQIGVRPQSQINLDTGDASLVIDSLNLRVLLKVRQNRSNEYNISNNACRNESGSVVCYSLAHVHGIHVA
jgi:hypothetical protein